MSHLHQYKQCLTDNFDNCHYNAIMLVARRQQLLTMKWRRRSKDRNPFWCLILSVSGSLLRSLRFTDNFNKFYYNAIMLVARQQQLRTMKWRLRSKDRHPFGRLILSVSGSLLPSLRFTDNFDNCHRCSLQLIHCSRRSIDTVHSLETSPRGNLEPL